MTTEAPPYADTLKSWTSYALRAWAIRAPRTIREFAEQEIILPNGPRAGLRFRCDFMPFSGHVLDQFSDRRYRRFFLSGPVQSGKTLLGFILPIMYHLFEIGESVIVGCPKIDMAQGIYEERLLPVIQASRYADLIPERGAGSKGGKFLAIRFKNGAWLRFLGAGGGDEQRSSYTSRVIVMTELDKMDEAGKASREADPVTQIEARSRAFGSRAIVYGECTMSIPEGRVYQEVVERGTDSAPAYPCPHCGEYIHLNRDTFAGWQSAEAEEEATAQGAIVCPKCEANWTEAQRLDALQHPRLIHGAKNETWTDEPKQTRTFGFRWTALSSPLLTSAQIAADCWKAAQTDTEEARRHVSQFIWAEAYIPKRIDVAEIGVKAIQERIGEHRKGFIPAGTDFLTCGIDLGLYFCTYTVAAWTRSSAEGYLIDYGTLDTGQGSKPVERNILNALRDFRDSVLTTGWAVNDTETRAPDMTLVDSGNWAEMTYEFIRESASRRILPSKGYGSGRFQQSWYETKLTPGQKPKPGTTLFSNCRIVPMTTAKVYLMEFYADHFKRVIHNGFLAEPGSPGALSLYKATRQDHVGFAKQITAETEEEEFIEGKGIRTTWKVHKRSNHYLDSTVLARVAAEPLGIGRELPKPKPKKTYTVSGATHTPGIRTTY